MLVKLVITVDVNDWDYTTKEIHNVSSDGLIEIKELLSRFLWSHVIDIREKGWKDILNEILTAEEQNRLVFLLYKNSDLYLFIKECWLSYSDLFSWWINWHDQPHTLVGIEVIEKSYDLL